MFFKVKVNSLNQSDIVYFNEQFHSGVPDHSREMILQLRDKILKNQLEYGRDLVKCPTESCPFIHLDQNKYLSRCDCIEVKEKDDRTIISDGRSHLDEYIQKDVQDIIEIKNSLTMTFWCSGKLFSEMVVITKVIESIKVLSRETFDLKINFIDKEYNDYIDLGLLKKEVFKINKTMPGEIEPMTVADIYKNQSSRDGAGYQRIRKIEEMNLKNIEPNKRSYIAAINSYLCFLKFILPSSIRTKARFFASDRHYQHMCVAKNEWHDLLVGHDIASTWVAMLALHTSTGKEEGRAIAWSKKYEEGKAVGIEIKRMLQKDSDWTKVEDVPFSRTYP